MSSDPKRYARYGAIITLVVILTALFGGNYFRSEHPYLIGFIIPAAAILAALLGYMIFKQSLALSPEERKKKIIGFVAVMSLAVAVCELSIVADIERIHFVKYGALSFFSFFAIHSPEARLSSSIWKPLALGAIVGTFEECAQHFLPGRIFDLRDIALNFAGAILGLLLAVVTARQKDEKPVP